MQKQTNTFAVVKKNGAVQKVGHSIITQPKTSYRAYGIKWFDDSKLLKKNQ